MNGPAQTDGGDKLASILSLEQTGDDSFRSVGMDRNLNGEVFGGQYLGLAVAAAMKSAGGRAPHVLQGHYLRSARADQPVDYAIERTRDGRAFAHRRITASQAGREAFRAEVSLHDWEEGQPFHAAAAPAVPPPEELTRLHDFVAEHAASLDPVSVGRVMGRKTFENCYLLPGMTIIASADAPALTSWVHPNDPPDPADPVTFYATLAYLGDACGNFACRTPYAKNLFDGSMLSVTLNHSVWFHSRPRPIDWVLYVTDSPFAGGGLGYNRGSMFDRDGVLLASVAQEALIRYNTPLGAAG